ncbi:Mitochondrial acidic protein mam33 [Phlyctochytrium planicorne]|nr:Mitochondrial acidic protein mam33 [Phlyctochytrium planicorne]
MMMRSILRPAFVARACMQRAVAASAVTFPRVVAQRAFSVTPMSLSHGKVDRDLSHKLREELKFEESPAEGEDAIGEPAFLTDFKKSKLFKIEDKTGEKEISLVRTFGNEKITAIFSTDALSDSYEYEEDAVEDEEKLFPVNVTILIEKKTSSEDVGAMEISAVAQDKTFLIESVTYSNSSSLINDQTAEGDWQRRGRYGGPVFTDLDDDLQDLFHNYLAERGFDENLAEFIPLYIEWKEQNEYTNWLKKVANWVEL